MDVSKNRGENPKKMDGENNGKPYFLMDDLGGKNPYFWKHPYIRPSRKLAWQWRIREFSIRDTSSNDCFSIVMLAFGGIDIREIL